MDESVVFIDGDDRPNCRCGGDCDFPCWQRVGIAAACEVCGCDKREPEGEHLGDRIDQEEE